MSAIWESANWTRQFGIRQTGNRQFGMLPTKHIKFINTRLSIKILEMKLHIQSSAKSIGKRKKTHILSKKYCEVIFWIDFNKLYTKTFGIIYILFVYLLIMFI